ncbi:MAG: hypothetical protein HKN16_05525 [Saprospiraceae bacterium]|nr:hypothetical protein [Saprospiraceae bacterium]
MGLKSILLPFDSMSVQQAITPGADTLAVDYEILDWGSWTAPPGDSKMPGLTWSGIDKGNYLEFINTIRMVIWQPGIIAMPPALALVGSSRGDYDLLSQENLLFVNLPDPQQIEGMDSTGLAPIKPIILTRTRSNLLLWIGLFMIGLAGFLALAFFLLKKFFFKKAETPLRIIPPHEKALEAIKEIERKEDWKKLELKSFYSDLTRVLRQYLEDRFEMPAMESTSSEILESARNEGLDAGYLEKMKHLLPMSDMVKFAKAEPAEEHHKWIDWLRSFVLSTKKEETLQDESGAE